MDFKIKNFFTNGWFFDENELEIKSKFQMINIALVLSLASLLYAIFVNYLRGKYEIIPVEIFLVVMNVFLYLGLKRCQKAFSAVATLITFQFTVFFLFLFYTYEPSELKHIWLFTYPIILLYLQDKKISVLWFSALLFLILVAPFQNLIHVHYSIYQTFYIAFVLVVISIMINFYKMKMEEAKTTISKQQTMLQNQAKQAVMGEMISMIAHQWRQPLSTVTLNVSNLQIKQLLGEHLDVKELDKALEDISNTVVYLSETIDDFQTYFNPNKELSDIEIHELLNKAISFVQPRLKTNTIVIEVKTEELLYISTYVNELIQVVLNILNNAIDILEKEATKNAQIILFVQETDTKILLSISDNASGIDNEILPQIFHPYFSTKGKNGTGLGLYMSQMIVQKQFNGEIKVETSAKGTIFCIEVDKKLK